MRDLEFAKNSLKEKSLSLVIVKAGKLVYETREYGVIGIIKAIENHGEELVGASAADRVVGRAAAMLCRHAGIVAVYADVISEPGLKTLRESGIIIEYSKLVPEILDKNRKDKCPFEKLVADCRNEEECYRKIKEYLNPIRQ
ncbi:MAG: DUF1893 domain-containing protein [Thermoproteota archaeon]